MLAKSIPLDRLNQILMQFGQNIGLGNFCLDENRSASLIFDDRFLVELQALDIEGDDVRTLYFISVLCPDPEHKDETEAINFYQQLLQSNLSGKIMSGISFALDREHKEILLLKPLSVSQLVMEGIEIEMERFVNVLEQWASNIKNGTLSWAENHTESNAPPSAEHGNGGVRV
jgi:hypothetical protein